jgi:hypothetical protein
MYWIVCFLPVVYAVCLSTVNTTLCPQLAGASKPSTFTYAGVNAPEPDQLYTLLTHTLCTNCSTFATPDYLCALVYYLYSPCTQNFTGPDTPLLPCRRDCQGSNVACQVPYGYNVTYSETHPIDCSALVSDTGCVSNSGGSDNICYPPSFLLRKTAHVYNYIWIFVIGGGGLLLLLILVIVLVYFCLGVEALRTLINPCRWCECCPGYYDI